MTQRLGLARVLLHDPQVLLLDEPASGLDPRARIEIRSLLKQLRSMGKTILVSSHILPELADVCNKIGIIERGQLLVASDVAEVMRRVRRHILLRIRVAERSEPAARLLEGQPNVEHVDRCDDGTLTVHLAEGITDYSELPTTLVGAGFRLTLFREEELNLETAFLELTKGITA
jgi:ABC-2 type transport system ATP-binding protein